MCTCVRLWLYASVGVCMCVSSPICLSNTSALLHNTTTYTSVRRTEQRTSAQYAAQIPNIHKHTKQQCTTIQQHTTTIHIILPTQTQLTVHIHTHAASLTRGTTSNRTQKRSRFLPNRAVCLYIFVMDK